MLTVIVGSSAKPDRGRPRPEDIDRHVGARIRQRRITLGLTQHQMAELIGVSDRQQHKYEKGIVRVASRRLCKLGKALRVDVEYLLEGSRSGVAPEPTPSW